MLFPMGKDMLATLKRNSTEDLWYAGKRSEMVGRTNETSNESPNGYTEQKSGVGSLR